MINNQQISGGNIFTSGFYSSIINPKNGLVYGILSQKVYRSLLMDGSVPVRLNYDSPAILGDVKLIGK